jgi:hypothetical protein
MSRREKMRLANALLFGLLGVAELLLVIFRKFEWLRLGFGILLVITAATIARRLFNERMNASS